MQVRYNFDRKWLAARVYVSLDGLKKSWTMVSTTALEKKKKKKKQVKLDGKNPSSQYPQISLSVFIRAGIIRL